jgi:peptidoglycan hydrolase-like amidase
MVKFFRRFFIFGLIFSLFALSHLVRAIDPIEDIQKQIDEINHLRELSVAATTPLESTFNDLQKKINKAQADIKAAQTQEKNVAANITQRETDLASQYRIFSARVAQRYKRSALSSPLLTFVSNDDASQLTRDLAYRLAAEEQDNKLIHQMGQDIRDLEQQKKDLQSRQARLASLSADLDKQASFFRTQIEGAKAYQAQLSSKIAELSAKQQEILAQKSGTFQTTVGDVPLADDPASRPDYSPGFSPAFAAFSFGAPHFKGLSQYGALGRAQSGQSADEILKAYYGNGIEIKKDFDTGRNICVGSSRGSCTNVDLETYAKRIYEMPGSWGDKGGQEALKAQAVAARSYALNSMDRNGYICPTESCQVYKPQNKGGKWEEAVNATKGWVLLNGGKPFFAQYASTSGGYQESYSSNGYSTPSLWDTKDGRAGWTAQAYEKIAGSPWFYKGWYRSRAGDSCGRSHPWLNGEEMADILNTWVVLIKNGQSDSRVTPSGSCWGGNPYSINELRDKANGLGGGYGRVTGVSVSYGTNGVTANVNFETDKGSVSINGKEFYKAFNLRAPGNISLKSGLFNIEKK